MLNLSRSCVLYSDESGVNRLEVVLIKLSFNLILLQNCHCYYCYI